MSRELHQVHKSRWNRFKKMNKRRVNQFLQAKKVADLESRLAYEVELAKLNSEQTNDLIQALELKVSRLVETQKKLKARIIKLESRKPTQKESLLAMFKKVLCSKGKD